MAEMRQFTKDCHKADVLIHGTFILGLPVETQQTIQNTMDFAKELDVFSIQVSLAAPYPAPNYTRWPSRTAGSPTRTRLTFVKVAACNRARSNIRLEQGQDRRGTGSFLSRLLSAPETHPAHYQDDVGRQGHARAPHREGFEFFVASASARPTARPGGAGVNCGVNRFTTEKFRRVSREVEPRLTRPFYF